jgi:hypothetical protein
MGFTISKNWNALQLLFLDLFHIFANWELCLQLSIWVLIISQNHINIYNSVLDSHSLSFLIFVIRSILIKLLQKRHNFQHYVTVTNQILLTLQTGEWEAKEHTKLHNAHIYHILIRSVLKYIIGAQVLTSWIYGSSLSNTRPKNHYFIRNLVFQLLFCGHIRFLPHPELNRGLSSSSNLDHSRLTCNRC